MPTLSPNSSQSVSLTPDITLHPSGRWQGDVRTISTDSAVLSGDDIPRTDAPLHLFSPVGPAVHLDARPLPHAAVLGADEPATLTYRPTDDAVYALLQIIHTADGPVYDWTLPRVVPAASSDAAVLSGETAGATTLHFPINPIITETPAAPTADVLGIEDIVSDLVGSLAIKRVLQLVKSPISHALLDGIRHAEAAPHMLVLRDTLQPLTGFEAWRALLPPGAERRILLFIHGFASSSAGSHAEALLAQLATGYDAVLSYDHPTIASDPLQNARDLLAMVPDDLRLSVDLIAHSRGGLVARSLVELAEPTARFTPRVLVTHGSPHNGTRLADPERWDRLISLGMTAASWLATTGGVTCWVPTLLEFVLKAAAQGIFELPGIAAMTPDGPFLKRLNDHTPPSLGNTRYAVVTSRFSIFGVKQRGFQQALTAFASQAFIDAPNDLVVPTESMSAIDRPFLTLPPDRQLNVSTDHFSYFTNTDVLAFLRRQLATP